MRVRTDGEIGKASSVVQAKDEADRIAVEKHDVLREAPLDKGGTERIHHVLWRDGGVEKRRNEQLNWLG
jgi:hypothetical protein